jgi:hypothetical protein
MIPGDYLEEALYGAYVGTVTVDGPPLSDHEGGDPSRSRKPPGQTDYGPIRLERGVTYDLGDC